MEEIEFTYRGTSVALSKVAVECLGSMGIAVDERYLDSVYENRSPLGFNLPSMLVWRDISNRRLYSQENGLGRIVAYLDDGPHFYENLYDAIVDNWDKRPEMGFERLHERAILPIRQKVERFGISVTVSNMDVRLRSLNDLSKTIYRYKGGVTWRRTYDENTGKPGVEDLPLDEFLRRMTRFFASSLGDTVIAAISYAHEKQGDSEKGDVHAYRNSLVELLARYSDDNGSTALDEVTDLNKYKWCSGVYVLSLDSEMQYYVGQAGTSIRDRIVEHFRRPSSAFDRAHSFTDISAIHVLPVYDEWFGLVDRVEADCIATLGPDHVCNAFAASPAWFEAMVRQLDNFEKLDPEFSADALLNELYFPVMYDGIHSDAYEPTFFQMSSDEVRRVVKEAPHVAQAAIEKQAKMAARTTRGRHPIARLDDNMQTLEIYQSVAEASRSVGVSTKSLRDAARGVQKHAGGFVWRYVDEPPK